MKYSFSEEEIRQIVLLINEEKIPVIVEGKRDMSALSRLGIKAEIIPLNKYITKNKMSWIEFIEYLSSKKSKKFLILTDFDEAGEKLSRKLVTLLNQEGLIPLQVLRRRIKRLIRKKTLVIEGL
ncbi:MAG: toprim domain-containing protein [Candidatus Asgardarchaeia archaeon]